MEPRIVRRTFLQALGLSLGGLAIGVTVHALPKKPGAQATSTPDELRPNVFVHVSTDGTVTIVCHRSEMGQGIRSSLPVLIADELGADLRRVTIVQADGDAMYGDQNTDGSSSVRTIYLEMRRVAAVARTMLVETAAARWGVPPGECVAREGAVTHVASKRSVPFGALVADAVHRKVPEASAVKLRPDGELSRVGGPLPLVDGPDYVTGRARFGADVRVAGMLVAVVARPRVMGGSVKSFDAQAALAIPGVTHVIALDSPSRPYKFKPLGGVAVIARDTWSAMRGRAALSIVWDDGDNGSTESALYREDLFASVRKTGEVARHLGDVDEAMKHVAKTVEAEYFVPHLAHAPMEPPVALASYTGDACEVWTSTQNPQAAREEVASAVGLSLEKVTVHVTFLGGGFGRKSKPDYVVEAALLSKKVGAPVRVQWTRQDDIQHDYYHSTCANRMVAGLDGDGKVIAYLHRNAFPPIASTFVPLVTHGMEGELGQGMLEFPLDVANLRLENGAATPKVRIGWMRSVHNINYAFATGSFLDEIAHARGDDPRDVLLEIIGPARVVGPKELGVGKVPNYGAPLDQHPVDVGRLRGVIERVTALCDWKAARAKGRFLGLAAHRSFLTYVAVVASVVVRDRKVHVDEAWVVADAGKIINPDRATAQMEGAFVFGMSIALHGEITLARGAVQQTNFRDYKITRIAEVPRAIHVELVQSDRPPGGIGEPGVPPVAPAIANAVFAATGTRVRDLPIARAGLV